MSQIKDPDESEFAFTKTTSAVVAQTPTEDVHRESDKKIRDHNIYPSHMPPEMRTKPKYVQILHKKTRLHAAERFFQGYEQWWITHQLKPLSDDPDYDLWKEMLEADPIGANTVPTTVLEC